MVQAGLETTFLQETVADDCINVLEVLDGMETPEFAVSGQIDYGHAASPRTSSRM